MRSKVKYFVLPAIICILISSFVIIKNRDESEAISYNKGVSYVASYVVPDDLDSLEDRSEIVVSGTFTGDRKIDSDESLVGPSSVSSFNIDEVYKGKLASKTISVLEPCAFEDDNFINIEGYIPMKENEEYLLFLRENDTLDGKQYSIISMSFGKYNLSSNKTISPVSRTIENFSEVSNLDFATPVYQECDAYNNIKSQVLKKYQ